ncbi:hypothetical protein BXA17_19870, partial [Acinetobacter baumannii]
HATNSTAAVGPATRCPTAMMTAAAVRKPICAAMRIAKYGDIPVTTMITLHADGDEPPTSVHILMTGRNRGCTHRDSMIALKVVLGRMASATSSSSGW